VTSLNAIKIRIYSAMIVYCLKAIVVYKLKVDRPPYDILQILGISHFDKTPLKELLTSQYSQDAKKLNC